MQTVGIIFFTVSVDLFCSLSPCCSLDTSFFEVYSAELHFYPLCAFCIWPWRVVRSCSFFLPGTFVQWITRFYFTTYSFIILPCSIYRRLFHLLSFPLSLPLFRFPSPSLSLSTLLYFTLFLSPLSICLALSNILFFYLGFLSFSTSLMVFTFGLLSHMTLISVLLKINNFSHF